MICLRRMILFSTIRKNPCLQRKQGFNLSVYLFEFIRYLFYCGRNRNGKRFTTGAKAFARRRFAQVIDPICPAISLRILTRQIQNAYFIERRTVTDASGASRKTIHARLRRVISPSSSCISDIGSETQKRETVI